MGQDCTRTDERVRGERLRGRPAGAVRRRGSSADQDARFHSRWHPRDAGAADRVPRRIESEARRRRTGTMPIEFLSDAAEPRCVSEIDFSRGRRLTGCPDHPPGPASGSLPTTVSPDYADAVEPGSETGQVADYGRLRGPVYSLQNELSIRTARGGSPAQTRAPGAGKSALEHQPAPAEEVPRDPAASSRVRRLGLDQSRTPPVPRSSVPRPAAPQSAMLRISSAPSPGSEDAPLLGREPGAGDPLHLGQSAAPKLGRSALDQRRKELHQHEVGDPLDLALRRGRQLRRMPLASASPLSPGLPGGTAMTQRQLLGDLDSGRGAGRSPPLPSGACLPRR